jgi:hypothetical protein
MLTLLSLLAAPPAFAEEDASELEVVVTADPFARFDDTRWRVDYQMMLPYPVVLYSENNKELNVVAMDVRMVVGCDLGEKLGRKTREVFCVIEDASLSAAPWQLGTSNAEDVLVDTTAKLTGLEISLQVTDDGRITNVGLVGEPQGIRRVNILYENLRQIVKRAFVGFHLKASGRYQVGEEWTEKQSELFSIPIFRRLAPTVNLGRRTFNPDGSVQSTPGVFDGADINSAGTPDGSTAPAELLTAPTVTQSAIAYGFETLQAPASYGWSVMAHRMDKYQGRYLVQSYGTGTVDVGSDVQVTFRGEANAVSVFHPQDAIMTERAWTVTLNPTASSVLADGVAGWPYVHIGNLRMLGDDEPSEVGASALVAAPQTEGRGNLPPWPSL